MTLSKSLFDKGIYKSVIRRFFWGSLAYFILLFLSSTFRILIYTPEHLENMYRYTNQRIILTESFSAMSMVLSLAVPVVVALLIFRFLHAKKQNIFVHSLPVTRTCNYISSMLGGFTLMAVPVLLNGLLLLLLSFFGYKGLIFPTDCGVFVSAQLILLFVIFSIAVFSSIVTGNSFSAVAVFGILNFLPLIIGFIIYSIGDMFVYGFYSSGEILEYGLTHNPLVWMGINASAPMKMYLSEWAKWVYIGIAILFYALSLLLYNLRKGEKAGDVTAFNCMNPIIKYTVSFSLGLLFLITIFTSSASMSNFMIVLCSLLVTALIYFICEMVLRKEFKVFDSYKGCIVLCVLCVALIGVISATGFFGYSNFVPKAEDIESATLLPYLNDDHAYSSQSGAISLVQNLHNEMLEKHTFVQRRRTIEDYQNTTTIHVWYKLKNGKEITRKYYAHYEYVETLMAKIYEFDDFKYSYNQILSFNAEDIISINLVNYDKDFNNRVTDAQKIAEFMEIYHDELSKLSYEQMYCGKGERSEIYVEFAVKNIDENDTSRINYYMEYIQEECPKTLEWISNYVYTE